jgi:UDP-glucose 4-epimerase
VKKICIVGSTGYVGSHLCQYLKKDFHIIACSRKKSNNSLFNQNIKDFVYGDINRHEIIDKIIKLKPNTIIYTISLNHFDSEISLTNSLHVNVAPFLYLLNKIKEKQLNTKIIYFSTMQVYGREYKKKIINENHPKKLNNIYSLTHSMCEDALISQKQFFNFSILRLSNAFGSPIFPNKNVWWPVLNDICKMAKKNGVIKLQSDGSALRDFISLNNIGLFIKNLIEAKNVNNEIIHLCSGKTFSILDVAKKVSTNYFFETPIPIKKKKSPKKKNYKFRYDNSRMKKYLSNYNFSTQKEIYQFLSKI